MDVHHLQGAEGRMEEEAKQGSRHPSLPQLDGNLINGGFPVVGSSRSVALPTNTSQLTILYAGSVNVYNSITPEKAQAIMLIAAAAAAAVPAVPEPVRASSLESSTAEGAFPSDNPLPTPHTANSLCGLQAALPIARRNSLQRFLEKRRERLVSKTPYSVTKMPESPSGSCNGSEPSTPPGAFNDAAAKSP